jgi:hypothetical protein
LKPLLFDFLEQDARRADARFPPLPQVAGKRVGRAGTMRNNALGKLVGLDERADGVGVDAQPPADSPIVVPSATQFPYLFVPLETLLAAGLAEQFWRRLAPTHFCLLAPGSE